MLVGCVFMANYSNAVLRTIPVVPSRPRYPVFILYLAAYPSRKDYLLCLPIRGRGCTNGNFGDQCGDHCAPEWSSFTWTVLCSRPLDLWDDQDQTASFQTLAGGARTVHQSLAPLRKLLGIYTVTPIYGHILGRSSAENTRSFCPAAPRLYKERC